MLSPTFLTVSLSKWATSPTFDHFYNLCTSKIIKDLFFFLGFYTFYFCVCVGPCQGIYVAVSAQLVGIISLLLPHVSWQAPLSFCFSLLFIFLKQHPLCGPGWTQTHNAPQCPKCWDYNCALSFLMSLLSVTGQFMVNLLLLTITS